MPIISLAPINTGMYEHGNSTPANALFFSRRASGGIHTCIVGNAAVLPEFAPTLSSGVMSTSSSWRDLADTIRQGGSTPGIQLSCVVPGIRANRSFVASNRTSAIENYVSHYSAIPESLWLKIEGAFIKAIRMSRSHGFEHIQIHCAHGYLLSLALDPAIDTRGRGVAVLQTVLCELVRTGHIQKSMRVSWHTSLGHDKARQSRILEVWIPHRSAVQLDLSNGYYNLDKNLIYPAMNAGEAPGMNDAVGLAKRFPDAAISFAGNIWDPYLLATNAPTNICFSIARPLIADPDHLRRMRNGDPMICDSCAKCHYYSRGSMHLVCSKCVF